MMPTIPQELYKEVPEDRHQGQWRTHERVKPGVKTLRSLSWSAYVWANRYFSPWCSKKDVLLDLGGGYGNFSYLFQDKVRRIIVLDLVYSPLATITELSTDKIQGDIFRIPLKDCSVNKILFSDVMEHFAPQDVPLILDELYRVLSLKGTEFVNTSCYGYYLRRHFYRAMGRYGRGSIGLGRLEGRTLQSLQAYGNAGNVFQVRFLCG